MAITELEAFRSLLFSNESYLNGRAQAGNCLSNYVRKNVSPF